MIPVLLAEDVRRQDAEAASHGITVEQLMENAGAAVARVAREMLGGCYGKRVVIACGKGNNAGDGLVAGRLLHARGAHVTAVLTSEELSPLAAANRARFPGAHTSLPEAERALAEADLVIDALLGVGVTRAPSGAVARAIELLAGRRVLSVDVPSGVDADTGRVFEPAARAERTVTFTGLKPGLVFMPGAARAGALTVADIGIPVAQGAAVALERGDLRGIVPARAPASHKRAAGTVLVLAGSRAMPGAAALTTAAAVHGGAGLTTLCAPEEVCQVVLARVPEITTIPLPGGGDGVVSVKALEAIGSRLGEFSAIACGPGLSRHPAAAEAVRALLQEARAPVVLDADGLNAFEGHPEELSARGAPTVLTPHAGELARLLGRDAAELGEDRLASAAAAARQLRSVVVFKGAGSVIASRDARFVNTTGSAALAQGGTGDVLTGLTAAFVAQARASTEDALARLVAAAVWVHGRAGDRLAERLWPHPANASALIEEIGPTLHEVFA